MDNQSVHDEALEYIKTHSGNGHSRERITEEFLKYGWTKQQIDDLFSQLETKQDIALKQRITSYIKRLLGLLNFKKSPLIASAIVLATLLIIVSGAWASIKLISSPKKSIVATHVNLPVTKSKTEVTPPTVQPSTPTTAPKTTSPVVSTPVKTVAPIVHVPPNCTKSNLSINSLSPLGLNSLSPNVVHIVKDPINYYQVYGYTGRELSGQMTSCTPVVVSKGTFYAYTEYYESFIYNWAENNGVCSVSSYTVGVHFAQFFPTWSPSPYDEQGLDSYWSGYISSLVNFEQGHINIITQYANQLASGLASYTPSSDCGTNGSDFVAAVNSYGNNLIEQGYSADTSYDDGSGHGPIFTFN